MTERHSTRQPSTRFLTSQSLFLEVNASRDRRLQAYQSKAHFDRTYALRLTQELEADLSFYCEAQREVERLLDEIQALKTRLLHGQMELNLERSLVRDFARSKQLEVELLDFCVEQLQPKVKAPAATAA